MTTPTLDAAKAIPEELQLAVKMAIMDLTRSFDSDWQSHTPGAKLRIRKSIGQAITRAILAERERCLDAVRSAPVDLPFPRTTDLSKHSNNVVGYTKTAIRIAIKRPSTAAPEAEG